jgi:hypothetical protein
VRDAIAEHVRQVDDLLLKRPFVHTDEVSRPRRNPLGRRPLRSVLATEPWR